MTIPKIVISLLLMVLPVVVLIRDWKYHDKRTIKHHMITRIVIVIWLVCSIGATYFVWSDVKQIDELVTGKNLLVRQNLELSAKADRYQDKLEARSDRNFKLAEENIELNKQLSSWVTGGDSACFIFPMIDMLSERQTLQLFQQGESPLYDVVISIEDWSTDIPIKELYDEIVRSHKEDNANKRERKRDLSSEMDTLLETRIKKFDIGTLPPNTTRSLLRLKLPTKDTQQFFIRIFTRSGYFTQIIKQHKINGAWQSTWQLLKHSGNGDKKEIATFIGPQFPYTE